MGDVVLLFGGVESGEANGVAGKEAGIEGLLKNRKQQLLRRGIIGRNKEAISIQPRCKIPCNKFQ